MPTTEFIVNYTLSDTIVANRVVEDQREEQAGRNEAHREPDDAQAPRYYLYRDSGYRPVRAALWNQEGRPAVSAAVVVFVALVVGITSLYGFLGASRVDAAAGDYSGQLLMSLFTAGVAFWAYLRSKHREELQFWGLIAVALTADAGAWMLFAQNWGPEALPYQRAGEHLLYLCSYALMFLAAAAHPHARPDWSIGNRRHRAEVLSILVLILGFFVYFNVVASLLTLDEVESYLPAALTYPILDVLVGLAFLSARRACDSTRWSRVYGMFAAAALCWFALDVVEAFVYAGRLPWELLESGTLWNLAWHTPYFFIVLAGVRREGVAGDVTPQADRAFGLAELRLRPSTVAYPLILPAVHLVGYQLGWLDPEARAIREVCTIAVLFVLGGVSLVYQRRLEGEREALVHRLRHAERTDALGRLAGGVAHDFNNLLTTIAGNAELLSDGLPLGDPTRANAKEILDASDRAAWITSQLLSVAQPGARRSSGPSKIDAIIEETLPLLRRLIREDVEICFLPGADPWTILCDRAELVQLVMNLAINGAQAMGSGGVLTISTRPVRRAPEPDAEGDPVADVLITVSDTGQGFDSEALPHLFEPFYSTRKAVGGMGLGLSIVGDIVERNGGVIEAENNRDVGTTFSVRLPALDVAESEGAIEPPHGIRETAPAATILVVEDEEAVQNVLTRVLRSRGYRVHGAGSAEEAEEWLLSAAEAVDLLITDVVLPGRSGPELHERLGSIVPRLPVLFVSGYQPSPLPAGAHFLQKPFSSSTLLGAVDEALSNAEQRAEP